MLETFLLQHSMEWLTKEVGKDLVGDGGEVGEYGGAVGGGGRFEGIPLQIQVLQYRQS